jgi:hypothetical protein
MADIRGTSLLDGFDRAVPESPVLPPWYVRPGRQSPDIGGSTFSPGGIAQATSEAWLALPGGFVGDSVEMWAQQGEGSDLTEAAGLALFTTPWLVERNGYYVESGNALIGGSYTFLARYDAGTQVSLASHNVGLGANELLLLRLLGPLVQVWSSTDGGANWTQRFSVTDTTYRGPFYIDLRLDSDDTAGPTWTAVGGGVRNNQQIFRWLSN